MKEQIIEATRHHFEAKKSEARLRMDVYSSPVGVGEHPYVLAEYIKAVEDYEHADSCLSILHEV